MICWTDKHLKAAIGAFTALVLLALFIIAIGWFASQRTLRCCPESSKMAGSVLRVGLKKKYYWWWVWDLFRRVVILALFIPISSHYPPWLKQSLLTASCVVFLLAHCIVLPYEKAEPEDYNKAAFYSIPTAFLRTSKNACNSLEALVLSAMVIITLLSVDSLKPPSEVRLLFLFVLVFVPLLAFYVIAVWKVCIILKYRLNLQDHCLCLSPRHRRRLMRSVNRKREDTGSCDQLRDEILGPGDSYGSIEASFD